MDRFQNERLMKKLAASLTLFALAGCGMTSQPLSVRFPATNSVFGHPEVVSACDVAADALPDEAFFWDREAFIPASASTGDGDELDEFVDPLADTYRLLRVRLPVIGRGTLEPSDQVPPLGEVAVGIVPQVIGADQKTNLERLCTGVCRIPTPLLVAPGAGIPIGGAFAGCGFEETDELGIGSAAVGAYQMVFIDDDGLVNSRLVAPDGDLGGIVSGTVDDIEHVEWTEKPGSREPSAADL